MFYKKKSQISLKVTQILLHREPDHIIYIISCNIYIYIISHQITSAFYAFKILDSCRGQIFHTDFNVAEDALFFLVTQLSSHHIKKPKLQLLIGWYISRMYSKARLKKTEEKTSAVKVEDL